jgi:hypothetical protein
MVTFDQVKSNLQDVTPEQTGRCAKVWDFQTSEDFYLVESETDPTVEYEVRYSVGHGFTCTCAAGQVGFSKITVHPSGVCKHVRWAVTAWLEEEAALEAIADKIASQPTVVMPEVKPLPVSSIEASIPEWLKKAKPAPHMKKSPKER